MQDAEERIGYNQWDSLAGAVAQGTWLDSQL